MSTILVLLHNDLRIHDNPALFAACKTGKIVIPLYILDELRPCGPNSLAWLGTSLTSFKSDLSDYNLPLIYRQNNAVDTIKELARSLDISDIYYNNPHPKLEEIKQQINCNFQQFDGELLFNPDELRTGSKLPFRVFTPFMRAALKLPPPKEPIGIAAKQAHNNLSLKSDPLPEPNQISRKWQIGEKFAYQKFDHFTKAHLDSYDQNRNFPATNGNSGLSPHMHFGEISPRFIWHKIADYIGQTRSLGAQTFQTELLWREFSRHLLVHFPHIISQPYRPEFANFEWEEDPNSLAAWQDGNTGFPIVDAGMRELKQTGFMHNRVRMIVASFLTKDLLIHWKTGEEWFWQNLVDADLPANIMNWQWVAGCGVDAAPYYRIFNPYTQGLRFDPEAQYIKKYVPELQDLTPKQIHNIAQNPTLGYSLPIVDHDVRRRIALERFKELR